MRNKIIFICLLLGSLLTSCDKTYFEPNTPIAQTDLSGTNWLVTQSPLIGVYIYDTIHFISVTTYKTDTSSVLHTYHVYTSHINEDLSFDDATFWTSRYCGAILGLGFSSNNYFTANFKNLNDESETISILFTKL